MIGRLHGTRAKYRTDHCRCELCTDANRVRSAEDRAAVKAAKVAAGTYVDGRTTVQLHGTSASYRRGCRCPECKIAYTQGRRDALIAAGLTPPSRVPSAPKPATAKQGGNTGSPRVSQRLAVVRAERARPVQTPVKFAPTRIDQCGEPTGPLSYCCRVFPCVIHDCEAAA